MNAKVFVDVYSWVAAIAYHHYVPFEGIYRHAHALAREFIPVVCVSREENTKDFQRALRVLEIFIVKEILVFSCADEVVMRGPNVWLSIALDSPAPVLKELAKRVYRVAVLHDTLAYEGAFGSNNQKTFQFGAANNDMLLPVSESSLKEYQALPLPRHITDTCEYGCFHNFRQLPHPRTVEARSVTLGTVYPRKRFAHTAWAAMGLKLGNHHHIGRFVQSDDDALWQKLRLSKYLIDHGYKDDMFVQDFLAESDSFFMLSAREGFSMTPMEAILLGVPRIYLSPIPVHEEIYGDLSVNWVDNSATGQLLISEGQRKALFHRWCFARVIASFQKFLS